MFEKFIIRALGSLQDFQIKICIEMGLTKLSVVIYIL